jgi:hypothetical protein
MVSSGMLRRVALVRTDVSEEPGASFIRVTRIGELEQHYCVPFPSYLDALGITSQLTLVASCSLCSS